MLSIFRSNQQVANFIYLPYLALLFAFHFFLPLDRVITRPGILAQALYQYIPYNSLAGDISAIVLLFIQGFFINLLVAENKLNTDVNLLPGLFYILVGSMAPDFTYLSPILLANSFYLISLYNLFTTYNNNKSASAILNIGFFISIASLFYFSYLFLLIWGFLSLGILRTFNLRELLILFTGALSPFILIGVYYFWFDQLDYLFQYQFIESLALFDFTPDTLFTFSNYFAIGLMALLLVVCLVSYAGNINRKVREVQKKINILYWMLIIPILSFIFQAGWQVEHFAILTIPLSILIAFSFTRLPTNWSELFHLFLLAMVLFIQYHSVILPG